MNVALLEYEMKKKGVSAQILCEKIGISRSAFYRKCKGISDFSLAEIKQIVAFLELGSPMDIFFAN